LGNKTKKETLFAQVLGLDKEREDVRVALWMLETVADFPLGITETIGPTSARGVKATMDHRALLESLGG